MDRFECQGCHVIVTADADVEDHKQRHGLIINIGPEPHPEIVYRMDGEDVPESGMKEWHNSRGIPWGATFDGPEPKTISRMCWPGNLSVHLANEHRINSDGVRGYEQMAHMVAHTEGQFRPGQEHYHQQP